MWLGEVIIARHIQLLLYSNISFNAHDRKRTISLINFITVQRLACRRWQAKGFRVPGCLCRILNNLLCTEKVWVFIITIIIIIITFIQGIYNYMPETNHVSRIYSVAAVLYLQFLLHVMLFRPWNMFCTFRLALSVMCMQCPIWLFFCNSLISCFPGMLLRNCLSDFEMVPVAPVINRYHFRFHIPHALNFYYEVFIFLNLLGFFLDNISVSRNCSNY
jgi:membrane-associated HD superfamily phosphohydrolase